jgi:hypothetical protein
MRTGNKFSPEVRERAVRCCQSDGNLSPIDALLAEVSLPQAISDCHSASAAERRSLKV